MSSRQGVVQKCTALFNLKVMSRKKRGNDYNYMTGRCVIKVKMKAKEEAKYSKDSNTILINKDI